MGVFTDGAKISHYFDDDDAFFIRTDAEQGPVFFQREEAVFDQDNDFDTKNLKYSVYERYSTNLVSTSAGSTRTAAAPSASHSRAGSDGSAHPFPIRTLRFQTN
jgi:hypothetical protein